MASTYTKQQHLQKQGAALQSQMSVLAQAKPAIVSPSATNSFSIPTGALSEKINTALNLSSTALSQQERTDIGKLFSNYNNDTNNKQQQPNMQRAQAKPYIDDDNVLMKQNASNQMRQAAVMAAVASQHRVRLSATERLAMTARRPLTSSSSSSSIAPAMPPAPVQLRQTATDGSNASSTPLTGSKSASSLPTLETLLAVQRQLQQHTRQNLNSVPQQQMVNDNNNNSDKQQHQDAALKQQQNTRTDLSQQNSNELQSNTQYQPHAQCKKPLPPSPPKSPSLAQASGSSGPTQINRQCSVVTTYEKELPPLPQSVSPSTTCTTTDDSQMNSLESHQSSPATSLVSIPPPPPPISSYLEQYDEVNSACRLSNSSTPSTIATSDISSVKHYPFVQNRPIESNFPTNQNENHHYQQQQDCKPKPPTLAPKPTQFDYQRVLQNQTNHFNEKNQLTTNAYKQWSNNYTQNLNQQQPIASMKREFGQLQNSSYSQSAMSKVVTDSDSNESSSAASNVSYDVSYKPELNYQQHVFTRSAASLPTMSMQASLPPPPPPPSFSNQANNMAPPNITSGEQTSGGFDEVDSSAFRFPTPPPLDMLLDQDEADDDDDVKKPSIPADQYDDEDFQCRIPTPPHQKSMSSVSFQDFHSRPQHQRVHRKESLSPPTFGTTYPSSATSNVQPPALFRQSSHHLQAPQQQVQPSPPLQSANPVPTPQLIVHINNNESGLLSTATAANANNLHHLSSVNHHHHFNHHHMMLTSLATSSSSPSSSSDGDGQSSNSSSSTSGIHSSIDSPSSSNSKLDDFNYSASKLRETVVRQQQQQQNDNNLTNNNLKNISTKLTSTTTSKQQHHSAVTTVTGTAGVTGGVAPLTATTQQQQLTTTTPAIIKPALKQKKTVSFSDKVEMVACAEEQCEEHLPNPLLARVLSGKLQ